MTKTVFDCITMYYGVAIRTRNLQPLQRIILRVYAQIKSKLYAIENVKYYAKRFFSEYRKKVQIICLLLFVYDYSALRYIGNCSILNKLNIKKNDLMREKTEVSRYW